MARPLIKAQTAAVAIQAAEPLLGTPQSGRALVAGARALVAFALAQLAERELRGADVPGANDNASGTAVCIELCRRLAAQPLARTRVVLLLTGCEESGLLGSQAFLRSRDTSDWLFLNFDNVGAGTLHYVAREGIVQLWDADEGLLRIADGIRESRPDLHLERSEQPIGLTYDATPVLVRGGRAMTLVAAENGVIPNYHWPTDTPENVDPAAIGTALEVGAEIVDAVDAGQADPELDLDPAGIGSRTNPNPKGEGHGWRGNRSGLRRHDRRLPGPGAAARQAEHGLLHDDPARRRRLDRRLLHLC